MHANGMAEISRHSDGNGDCSVLIVSVRMSCLGGVPV